MMLSLVETCPSIQPIGPGSLTNRDQWVIPGDKWLQKSLQGALVAVRNTNRDQRSSRGWRPPSPAGRGPLVAVRVTNRDQRVLPEYFFFFHLELSIPLTFSSPFLLSLTQNHSHFLHHFWGLKAPIYSRVSNITLSSDVASLALCIACLAKLVFGVLARCSVKCLN